MKKKFGAALLAGVMSLSLCAGLVPQTELPMSASAAGASLEYLNRGITAVKTGDGMLVSWRFLATDPANAIFKLYRDNTLVYTSEAGAPTCFWDASGSTSSNYLIVDNYILNTLKVPTNIYAEPTATIALPYHQGDRISYWDQ